MKLHHIALTVKNLPISIAFYEELFNFKEVKRFRRDDMKATGCFIEGENLIIELWEFDKYKNGTREELSYTGIKHVAFIHENLEKFRNLLIEKGINCESIKQGKSGGSYFFLSDPDENKIEIYKPN